MTDFARDLTTIIEYTGMDATNITFHMAHFNRISERSVADLDLTVRGYNVCMRNKIKSVEDVVNHWDQLPKIKQAGKTTVKEIRNRVLDMYYDTLDEEERKQFWRDMDVA